MRKNRTKHEAKKPRLAKRALALCFALIFVCSCLLPAFANSEGPLPTDPLTMVEPQQDEQKPTEPILLTEGGTDSTEGNEQKTTDNPTEEPKPAEQEPKADEPKNEEPKTEETKNEGTTESKDSAEQQGNEQTKPEEPKTEGTTESKDSTEEQPKNEGTTGETKPEETKPEGTTEETKPEETKPAESKPTTNTTGDTIDQGKATYTYRFWPDKIDAFDLEAINDAVKSGTSLNDAAQSRAGMVPCTVLTVMTNANLRDYQANVQQPTKPGYEFAGWYTVDGTTEDEFSFEQSLNFEKSKTIDVFAKWEKVESTVEDEMEKTEPTTEDELEKTEPGKANESKEETLLPVEKTGEVGLANNEGDTVSIAVKAENLPGKVNELVVTDLNEDEEGVAFGSALGASNYADWTVTNLMVNITPKDIDGKTVQPSGAVRVTISDLSQLSIGTESIGEWKVLHLTKNNEIEALNVENTTTAVDSYGNTVLDSITFETDSFSPFIVAAKDETKKTQETDYKKWFYELVNCPDSEFDTLWAKYSADKGFNDYLDSLSNEEIAPLVARISYDTSLLANETYDYTKTIGIGSKEAVMGSFSGGYWSSSNTEFLTVEPKNHDGSNNQAADFFGISAGEAVVTHSQNWDGSGWRETFKVTVLSSGTYPVYIYTLVPGKDINSSEGADQKWNGMGVGTIKTDNPQKRIGTKLYSGHATIVNQIGSTIRFDDSDFPKITDSTVSPAKTYEYARSDSENALKEGFYTITWVRVVVGNGANKGNNANNLVGGSRIDPELYGANYGVIHLDGVVNLNDKDIHTVQFSVKDAGADDFVVNDNFSQRVENGTVMSNSTKVKIPQVNSSPNADYQETKTDKNDVQYKFDGWYRTEACRPEDKVTNWESEIVTGNVIYYARYVPNSVNIELTKIIKGFFADRSATFNFKYNWTLDGKSDSGQAMLGNNETTTILTGVPLGATLTITEINSKGYTLTANVGTVTGEENDEHKTITLTVYGDSAATQSVEDDDEYSIATYAEVTGKTDTIKIVATNTKDGTPDTGVLLDTLPYLILLAVAVAGGVLVVVRKRKHRDE